MDLGLQTRIAVITGAGGGIGEAIARLLVDEGMRVVVADINGDSASNVAKDLNKTGKQALGVRTDVTDPDSVAHLFEETIREFGTVHALVNNAGFTRDMRITKMSVSDWESVVDVILKGTFLCTKAALPYMIGQQWGRVVNISSRAHLGNPGQANYSAAKAGLLGFTRALSLENARHNITVNAVAPGVIETAAVSQLAHFEKVKAAALSSTPVGRLGTTRDVAAAVAFLLSASAGYISGEVVHVTGGRY